VAQTQVVEVKRQQNHNTHPLLRTSALFLVSYWHGVVTCGGGRHLQLPQFLSYMLPIVPVPFAHIGVHNRVQYEKSRLILTSDMSALAYFLFIIGRDQTR